MTSAFNRFVTKARQAVTDAEKTEIDPALKEALRQFDETRTLGDHMRDAVKEACPIVGSSSKMTKTEQLGNLWKQAAAKYGAEKPEAQGLQRAGEILMAVGKEERAWLQQVEQGTYALHKATHDYHETLKKEKSRLETASTDMDGAKHKLKSGKDGGAEARAQSATRTYETQKKAVEEMVATLPEHRDRQRQAAKALLESQREFYMRAAEIIERQLNTVG